VTGAPPRPEGPLVADPVPLRLPPAEPPRLLVVIDTEEEFDWSAPPSRSATAVQAMARVGILEEIFAPFGLVPFYATDWPVVSRPEGRAALRELHAAGRVEVGAHLHPWVSPPFDEDLSAFHTYAGNLPAALEREKLARLTAEITAHFGAPPRAYKAGRYGLGPNTGRILEELGYEIDLSVCPTLDSSSDGGPDYSAYRCEPYSFGKTRELIGIPLTAAFVGALGSRGRGLYRWANRSALAPLRLPAVLARTGLVDRLMLSPEGFTPAEHRRLVRHLLARDHRVFTWSFHSPSVLPGATPYVRTDADLRTFLDSFRRFFDWFFGELGGRPATPREVVAALRSAAARGAESPDTGSRRAAPPRA
jgi:hypothetical protein